MPRPTVPRRSSQPQNIRSRWRALFLLPAVDSHRTEARILRWALVGGLAVLLGTGLLKVFTGVLPGEVSAPPSHPTPQVAATSPLWSATVFTADRLILVTLEGNPNKIGNNRFTRNLVAMR